MDTPPLVVRARSDRELGLFLREIAVRDQALLQFHLCPPMQRDLRAFPMDHGKFLRTCADVHCLIQHRCVPSTFLDWQTLELRALRDLQEGEELTLNYHTIFEVLTKPFLCRCGDGSCYREVRGFRYLALEEKLKLELYLSPYLKRLLNDEVMALRTRVG